MMLKAVYDGKFDESQLKYPQCHKCIHDGKKSKACLTCTAKGTMLNVVRQGPYTPDTHDTPEEQQSNYATTLPPDVEDRFRVALCELFQLRPLELLVLQGIMQHKTVQEIADSLTHTFSKYCGKSFTKNHVWQLRKSMLTKMPTLKDALLTAGQKKELTT